MEKSLVNFAIVFLVPLFVFSNDWRGLIPKQQTPLEIVENYITAIGGREKLESIRNLQLKMEAGMEDNTLEITAINDQENRRMMQQTAINGNVVQKSIIKDGKGVFLAMGKEAEIPEEQLELPSSQAYVFPELYYEELGYVLTLAGREKMGEEEAYKILLTTVTGITTYELYSVKSGLKLSTGSDQAGKIDFRDYREVDGIKIPMSLTISNAMLEFPLEAKVVLVQFNQELEDSDFEW